MVTTLNANTRIGPSGYARKGGGRWIVVAWLAVVSASFALAVTVSFFDRTTLAGVSRLWLASLAVCFTSSFVWWVRPQSQDGRLRLASYKTTSLMLLTLPLFLGAAGFVLLVYTSDGVHGYVYHQFYYARLLSKSYWPVGLLTWLFLGGIIVRQARNLLLMLGDGSTLKDASIAALSGLPSILPIGTIALGLLLSTASLSMINVNFWRYWATTDGWVTIGHYPFTISDMRQIVQGDVARYFVSFPLLPSMLVVSYKLVGHNTLGSYLPIIVGNTLLPLAVYLTVKEITKRPLLALFFSVLTASFPLLRSYTMDVGEADGILMTTVVFAAYFTLRASRPDAGWWAQIAAGLACAIAAFAREEGILYVMPMYLAMLVVRWRDRRFWLSVLALALFLSPFVVVCIREFGMIWPGNHSATIALDNFGRTLAVARESGVFSMYAQALGVSNEFLVVLLVVILVVLVLSGIQMLRRDFRLAYMPAVALGDAIMVFFVGPVPAEAAKFQDLFRHMSYGIPLLAITVAYGFNEVLRCTPARLRQPLTLTAYTGLTLLVLVELSVLGGPVNPINTVRSPLLTSDPHVTAVEALVSPLPLPVMSFRKDGARYVPDDPKYMAIYPDDVYQHYASADIRRFDNPADYYGSAEVVFLALLVAAGVSSLVTVLTGRSGVNRKVADERSSGASLWRSP